MTNYFMCCISTLNVKWSLQHRKWENKNTRYAARRELTHQLACFWKYLLHYVAFSWNIRPIMCERSNILTAPLILKPKLACFHYYIKNSSHFCIHNLVYFLIPLYLLEELPSALLPPVDSILFLIFKTLLHQFFFWQTLSKTRISETPLCTDYSVTLGQIKYN